MLMVSFSGCVSEDKNNNDENKNKIPYATINEIDVIINFFQIETNEYGKYLILNVSIKNIANDDRRLIEHLYTEPSEDNYGHIIANGSEYNLTITHGDGIFEDKVILKSGKSFNYQFRKNIDNFYNKNNQINPYNESIDYYEIYIEIPSFSSYEKLNSSGYKFEKEYKASNTIKVDREQFIKN